MPPIETYCLLSIGPQFVHIEVFNRDRKLVSLNTITGIVYSIHYCDKQCGKTQEWLTKRRTSTCSSRKSPSIALWFVVGWFFYRTL